MNGGYLCCPLAAAPNALGLRLARGPVVMDLVIQCGRIALGAEPDFDNRTTVEIGFLGRDVVGFLESLSRGCGN